jgi:hypothetical protein
MSVKSELHVRARETASSWSLGIKTEILHCGNFCGCGGQVMGQCVCHVSALGAPSFIVPGEGVISDMIDKLLCLVFWIYL